MVNLTLGSHLPIQSNRARKSNQQTITQSEREMAALTEGEAVASPASPVADERRHWPLQLNHDNF